MQDGAAVSQDVTRPSLSPRQVQRASSLVLHLVRAFTVLASRMCRVLIPSSHGLTQFMEVLLEILNDCFFGHDGCLLRPFLSFPICYVGLDVQLL